MKRLLWITLCACMTFCALAQKQQGIVRTIERPGQKSVGLNGVTIKINEYPNAIVSGKGGKFSFTIQGKKQGDRCLVTRVEKKGYTLIDKLPSFAYSFSTPVEIVLVSNKQLQQDEKRIRDKAFQEAEARYHKRIAELERQLDAKTISEEQYREQLQHVFDGYKNYIKMIDDMARRYAMTDYKGISDINRQIQECIENAEFERADSLINSKGDIQQRKQKLDEKRDVKQKIDSLSLVLQEEINFGTNELASDFFTKHLICAERYDNDSAAYWLEQRAKLDTTNVEWLCATGIFIDYYIDDQPLAIQYFQKCVNQVKNQFRDDNNELSTLYNHIGICYNKLGNDSIALDYFNKALLFPAGEDSLTIANIYSNIGLLFSEHADTQSALDYCLKALRIRMNMYGENHASVANSYNNIGLIYYDKKDFSLAINYLLKALSIRELLRGHYHPETAITCNNIGAVYDEQGDYDMALDYYNKALDIQERVLGTNHIHLASTYNNIGLVYKRQKNYIKAKEFYLKSLRIYNKVSGYEHPLAAKIYNNLGSIEEDNGEYDKAIEYYNKALSIQEKRFGENHPETALVYNNIGLFYLNQKSYIKAIDYLDKAYVIFNDYLGLNNPYSQSIERAINYVNQKIKEQVPQ